MKVTAHYPCQRCKKEMAGTEQDAFRRKYCKKCFQESVAENKETFYCDVCGAKVTRRKKDRQFRFKCCSKKCQQKSRHLAKREINKDAIEARIAQKAIRVSEKSKRRNEESTIRPYWRAWVLVTTKVKARDEHRKDVWLTKIYNRILIRRPIAKKQLSTRGNHRSHKCHMLRAIAKIGAKVKYFEQEDWDRKICNKLSNHAKRMRVKHENKKASCEGNQSEASKKWIQMRFDWMGYNT